MEAPQSLPAKEFMLKFHLEGARAARKRTGASPQMSLSLNSAWKEPGRPGSAPRPPGERI